MSATRSRAMIVVLAATLLAGATSALAAHPKKHAHFSGSFTFTGVNGFKPPVSFTVSADGKKLTGFTYSTLGCFGAGGFQPGVNYYTKPFAIVRVGTVRVSSSGHFSASGAASPYTVAGRTVTTTTKVRGAFSKPKAASGTVSFSQKESFSGKTVTCTSQALAFTAKA